MLTTITKYRERVIDSAIDPRTHWKPVRRAPPARRSHSGWSKTESIRARLGSLATIGPCARRTH